MAKPEYERGFQAGLEFGRIAALTSYAALDAEALRFKAYLDSVFQNAIEEAEADPASLRRRLLASWETRPRPSAEILQFDPSRRRAG